MLNGAVGWRVRGGGERKLVTNRWNQSLESELVPGAPSGPIPVLKGKGSSQNRVKRKLAARERSAWQRCLQNLFSVYFPHRTPTPALARCPITFTRQTFGIPNHHAPREAWWRDRAAPKGDHRGRSRGGSGLGVEPAEKWALYFFPLKCLCS